MDRKKQPVSEASQHTAMPDEALPSEPSSESSKDTVLASEVTETSATAAPPAEAAEAEATSAEENIDAAGDTPATEPSEADTSTEAIKSKEIEPELVTPSVINDVVPEEPAASPPKTSFLNRLRGKLPPRLSFKWAATAVAGGLVLLVGGWLLCSTYQSKIAIAGTTLPAHLNDASLAQALTKQVAAYKLTLQHPDGTKKSYPLQELGLTLDTAASIQATRQQQHELGHRLEWWQPVPASIKFKTDTTKFNAFIDNAAHITVQPSQDAVLSITDGTIVIKDAVTGKQYGLSQPQETLQAAASKLQPDPIKLQALSLNPALTAHSLEAYKPLLEKTLNQSITLTIGDKVITPTPSDIASWLEITPDDKTKKVDIAVNSGKVQAYIDQKAAADIHPAKAQVETKRPDGSTQVLVTGSNGLDVPNKSETASAIAKNLLDGTGMDLSLPIREDQFQTINTGLYDKWIEVDLTTKQLYAYEKTNVVKTEPISAGAPATPTVTGQYAIYAKFNQQDMKGQNVDGSNYFQPHVRFINYFYKDYAIHGNYWRPLSYFGNINSSHGCVSMPDTEAEWIYNWAPIGTPVIVHT